VRGPLFGFQSTKQYGYINDRARDTECEFINTARPSAKGIKNLFFFSGGHLTDIAPPVASSRIESKSHQNV
jgi:hypothetical protein